MPGGPSFSVRPNYRRRRTVTLLVAGAVVAVAVVLLTRGGGGIGKKEPPIPTLAFVAKVTTLSQAKAPAPATAQTESDAIVKMLNDYYQKAFVDPRLWGDGTFPELASLFSDEVKSSFTKDIASLTIGQARTELKRVDPTASTLDVTVYYDAKQKPTFAVAVAKFAARGTLKTSGPPLLIDQTATFYLAKQGDAWRITAYDTNQSQETPTPSPTASPSA